MDKATFEKLKAKHLKTKLHVEIGEEFSRVLPTKYKKHQRKINYLIRRGERARMRLAQFESIPCLAKV